MDEIVTCIMLLVDFLQVYFQDMVKHLVNRINRVVHFLKQD